MREHLTVTHTLCNFSFGHWHISSNTFALQRIHVREQASTSLPWRSIHQFREGTSGSECVAPMSLADSTILAVFHHRDRRLWGRQVPRNEA